MSMLRSIGSGRAGVVLEEGVVFGAVVAMSGGPGCFELKKATVSLEESSVWAKA